MTRTCITFILALLFTSPSHATDAVAWMKGVDGSKTVLKLKNVKIKHMNGTIDEFVIILGSDGSKLSIPLTSVEGIYNRGAQYLVKTKTGENHTISIFQGMGPEISGDNEFGGTTSFNGSHMTFVTFK